MTICAWRSGNRATRNCWRANGRTWNAGLRCRSSAPGASLVESDLLWRRQVSEGCGFLSCRAQKHARGILKRNVPGSRGENGRRSAGLPNGKSRKRKNQYHTEGGTGNEYGTTVPYRQSGAGPRDELYPGWDGDHEVFGCRDKEGKGQRDDDVVQLCGVPQAGGDDQLVCEEGAAGVYPGGIRSSRIYR